MEVGKFHTFEKEVSYFSKQGKKFPGSKTETWSRINSASPSYWNVHRLP